MSIYYNNKLVNAPEGGLGTNKELIEIDDNDLQARLNNLRQP